jgi:two-component system, NtrC family, response regulator AtoC
VASPIIPARPPPTRPLRVLLVEDDENMLLILGRHLDRLGYSVRGAGSAEQGLALLEAEPADVVVSDVMMPGMGGRAFLRALRERIPGVRVVLMTAFGSGDEGARALREGACGYLAKPFKVEELAALLRSIAGELGCA